MTRTFVVVAPDGPTTPDFSLDDLPGAGRLDVLCRCVSSALLRSHGIRERADIYLVLGGEFLLRFEGRAVRLLHPDERSTGALVRTALEQKAGAVGRMAVETTPGVHLQRGDLATVLDRPEGPVFQLHEAGVPVVDRAVPEDPVFVLADHREFAPGTTATLEDAGADRVSLGPTALHADQAITVAHNWLDTDGFVKY